ncbi:MAG: hypothetical protein R2796_11855 [Chitinophagaceae bacterium]|nr:hypothetical protein [Chitinophagaceae bacterium]MCB0742242.1 hypothetical protein [Chitinophagaceae bacterium]
MRKYFLISFLFVSCVAFSQKPKEIGASYYKTFGQNFKGNLAGGSYASYNNKSSWNITLTYNFSAKSTYSQYKGFGLAAGYRYAITQSTKGSGIFAGAKVFLLFDNYAGKTTKNSFAIMPMAEAGYHFVFKTHYFASPQIGYGYTLKVSKDYNSLDEDAGQRYIGGLSLGYRF